MDKLVLFKMPERSEKERQIEESLGELAEEMQRMKMRGADPGYFLSKLMMVMCAIGNPECNIGQYLGENRHG